MADTAPTTPTKSLSQQFLDKYLADPEKNPYGQFYSQAAGNSVVGQLPRSFEKYGALPDPLALAKQLQGAGDSRAVLKASQAAVNKFSEQGAANYAAYEEPYKKAEALFRQQRQTGFATPEAEQEARQGLAAVREATFIPYLANRGYLQAQEQLTRDASTLAKRESRMSRISELLSSRGASQEIIDASLDPFKKIQKRQEKRAATRYGAVKDVGQGGTVELGDRLTAGESIKGMMNKAVDEASDRRWRKQYRDGKAPGQGAGYESRSKA